MRYDKPECFDDFVGNQRAINHLKMLIKASNIRKETLPHMGFFGFAGTGKTTLAEVVAKENGSMFVYINGGAIHDFLIFCKTVIEASRIALKIIDFSCITKEVLLNKIKESKGIIVLIDEAHSLPSKIQDQVLSLLSEGKVTIKKGGIFENRYIPYRMTFIFATTDRFKLREPIQRRVESIFLEPYTNSEMIKICTNYVTRNSFGIEKAGAQNIAKISLSAGRCINICQRSIDYTCVLGKKIISNQIVNSVLYNMGVDSDGFDQNEKRILRALMSNGGKLSLNSLEAITQINRKDILLIEPSLIKKGMIRVYSGGRELTTKGGMIIGMAATDDGFYV